MNAEKFTSKSQEAINGSNKIAVELNHQELMPLHLMLALCMQQGGLVSTILEKLGVSIDTMQQSIMEKPHPARCYGQRRDPNLYVPGPDAGDQ